MSHACFSASPNATRNGMNSWPAFASARNTSIPPSATRILIRSQSPLRTVVSRHHGRRIHHALPAERAQAREGVFLDDVVLCRDGSGDDVQQLTDVREHHAVGVVLVELLHSSPATSSATMSPSASYSGAIVSVGWESISTTKLESYRLPSIVTLDMSDSTLSNDFHLLHSTPISWRTRKQIGRAS